MAVGRTRNETPCEVERRCCCVVCPRGRCASSLMSVTYQSRWSPPRTLSMLMFERRLGSCVTMTVSIEIDCDAGTRKSLFLFVS